MKLGTCVASSARRFMFQEDKMDNAKYNGQNIDAQMIEHSKTR